jgi:hypothetical protein
MVPPEPAPVAHFALIASRFRALMETEPTSPAANLAELRKATAELHLAVLDLPDLQPDESDRSVAVDTSHIAEGRFTQMPSSYYWDIFEPLTSEPGEAVGNSVAGDLYDVYLEVTRGLVLYERGRWSDACWEWKLTFEIHWGEHLVGLQRALYWMAREHPPEGEGS